MKEEKEEIPLKTILQNFLNHVENLEVAREESNNGEGEDQYEKEFQVSRNKDLKLDELFYNSFTIILPPDGSRSYLTSLEFMCFNFRL